MEFKMSNDCTYLYFKPRNDGSGKYGYEGRGVFPPYPGSGWQEIDRDAIMSANGGAMPGVTGRAEGLTIIIIPDESCTHPFAYPRMLPPTG